MSLLIGILTFILVLNSLFLMLLILIQLPKKEAGLGMAFGGSATDALFGAGSGTVLSKVTKYCAGIFLSLTLVLAILQNHQARASGRGLDRALDRKAASAIPATPAPPAPAPTNRALPLLEPGPLTSALPPALKTVATNLPPLAPARPLTNAPPSTNK
jgi:preprotein translocase subunit SecG